MKILIIGGSGFIGSHVVDKLLTSGHSVRVFDRQPERYRAALAGVDYCFGDFADRMALVEALSGVDAVYHLLSTTVPGTADLDPKTDVQDNLVGTINLLDSMQRLGLSRILFLSSGGTVYGVPDAIPIPETHALRPINSYGIVKASIEHYLEVYRRTRGFSPIIIRASNPFGPRQAHSGVAGRDLDLPPQDIGGATLGSLGRRRCRAGLPRSRRSGRALRSRRNERQGGRIQRRQRAMGCRSTRSSMPFAK